MLGSARHWVGAKMAWADGISAIVALAHAMVCAWHLISSHRISTQHRLKPNQARPDQTLAEQHVRHVDLLFRGPLRWEFGAEGA